jgi:hypothetical protein
MRELTAARKKVVVLAASIAAMSGVVPLLARGHTALMLAWVALMFVGLVFLLVEFVKLQRQEP